MASLHTDQLVLRRLWRAEHVALDDIERLDGTQLVLRSGRKVRLRAREQDLIRSALRPLQPETTLAETFARCAEALDRPHGPDRMATQLLELAQTLEATALHVEPSPEHHTLRMRIEGELVEVATMPRPVGLRLVDAWKQQTGCLTHVREAVQTGRLPREGIKGDVRASFVPTPHGERLVLRLFAKLLRMDELGVSRQVMSGLGRLLAHRDGLVLVSGPSGSGKTTTLYAALTHLSQTRRGAHLSIEAPIEQRLRTAGIAVDQLEVDAVSGRSAEALLTAALSQNVDVLALGEIETAEQARLAVKAAHTGRLVLAGLHARSPKEARQRMVELGVDAAMLERTLRGVMQQTLKSTPCGCNQSGLCGSCRGVGRRRQIVAQLDPLPAILQEVA